MFSVKDTVNDDNYVLSIFFEGMIALVCTYGIGSIWGGIAFFIGTSLAKQNHVTKEIVERNNVNRTMLFILI